MVERKTRAAVRCTALLGVSLVANKLMLEWAKDTARTPSAKPSLVSDRPLSARWSALRECRSYHRTDAFSECGRVLAPRVGPNRKKGASNSTCC
jgi:hypothetical protein